MIGICIGIGIGISLFFISICDNVTILPSINKEKQSSSVHTSTCMRQVNQLPPESSSPMTFSSKFSGISIGEKHVHGGMGRCIDSKLFIQATFFVTKQTSPSRPPSNGVTGIVLGHGCQGRVVHTVTFFDFKLQNCQHLFDIMPIYHNMQMIES